MQNKNTTRFSNRVEDYVKYRPGYPLAVIDFLRNACNLTTGKVIADIGAGTGISTALFLNAGYRVMAVEPNREMRDKAIELLQKFPGFTAHNGTAENTGLDAESIDAVIAGQAFHWFDVAKTKTEFKRILKPGGIVALLWNERKTSSTFEKEYDELIVKHGHDYKKLDHRNISAAHITAFFNPHPVQLNVFPNQQVFDFDGLKGRLLSSSYMPALNDKGYQEMIRDVKSLFDKYQEGGAIKINYDTKIYVGELK